MGAVVDLRDLGLRGPEQVLRVFYGRFAASDVRLGLWKAYTAVAALQGQSLPDGSLDLNELALLFDQLIALTGAVEALIEAPPGRCPVCKRTGDPKAGSG